MNSAIFEGWVRHRRRAPKAHAFRYRLFMMQLDLDELDTVFEKRWLWSTKGTNVARFRRTDYFGDAEKDLRDEVLNRVAAETGERPGGKVLLLTHLRYFGYCFNPVSYYFCYDETGNLHSILAEITNTPWNERHAYVMRVGNTQRRNHRFAFGKDFHVSPFLPMDMDYRWVFSLQPGSTLVHIENFRDGERVFDATLSLQRREINGWNLARVLIAYPLMTVRVMAAIHWQALRLWLKRVPFYTHPAKREMKRSISV